MNFTIHRHDIDTDRCVCGGFVVYFDDGDQNGNVGEGCEVADLVFPPRCAICKESVMPNDLAEMYDPDTEYASEVHAECGVAHGWDPA